MPKTAIAAVVAGSMALCLVGGAQGQLVCLPAPRLLTMMPMGGQAGTTVEVVITGDNIDEAAELLFSTPKVTAKPKLAADGKPVPNTFVVTIAADAPQAVHDARVISRLGVSSARGFSVSGLREVTRVKPNTALATALELAPNSVCNATIAPRAVDFYSFQATKGKRVVVDCAAAGIDSKLDPVLIVADAKGRDLLVERRGGVLDFKAPADGKYHIKVHSLTYKGGPEYFYRLALLDDPGTGPPPRQAATQTVSAFSWPPEDAAKLPIAEETEPNNQHAQAQKITLPCEVDGRFFPAADVDTFEFTAKKGEEWLIVVASERLGLPTDPFVLVQKVTKTGDKETLTDVAELNDIASPIKPSTNGYSYDGPVYDAGSADVLGKFAVNEDGVYRLQVRDLFGGTRSEPRHVYRMVIRKPQPDFALAAWALHMNLRNGDRAALSKPLALRAGAAMMLEVAVVRRDGFTGPIDLDMSDLPPGVTACGLRIAAGKTAGKIVISADENAPRSFAGAKIFGRAEIDGKTVTRPCRVASMVWPVPDASQEIPDPRLLADVPVSVGTSEKATVTIAPAERKVWEVKAGEKLTIPLNVTWRSEFTGVSIKLNAAGTGFEGVKEIDIPLKAAKSELVLDTATLKLPPGEHALALYGSAVAKYRENPEGVTAAKAEQDKAEQEAAALAAAAKKLADEAKAAPAEKKADAQNAVKAMAGKQKAAEAAKAAATRRMQAATATATPKDIVDIVVSEPIRIVVAAKGKP
jgi:hypothetical protein